MAERVTNPMKFVNTVLADPDVAAREEGCIP